MFTLSNDFPCPIWGEWYPISNCSTTCTKIRQDPSSNELYKQSGVMVVRRNCTNERNHFNCKDYAKLTSDPDPMKLKIFKANVECNQNICSGESLYLISLKPRKEAFSVNHITILRTWLDVFRPQLKAIRVESWKWLFELSWKYTF